MTEKAAELPTPATPGPEAQALARFHRSATWTGTVQAGGMGPRSPEMVAHGRASCRTIQGGLWYVADFEQDQYLRDGTFVLRWELHWVAGWDAQAGEYRATTADNNGQIAVLRGWIDGDRLIFESIGDGPARIRLTWDLADPASPTWRNEVTLDGQQWQLIEKYTVAFES